jgi:hypothetical protein
MTLILLQAIIQSIASTLYWIGLYVGIRALPGEKSRRLRWTVGSAAVLVVWLVGVMLLAANDVFRTDAARIPVALLTTLAAGYLLLLSRTFRAIISGIPQHWLIGIQTFRILGGVFLVRYFQGGVVGRLRDSGGRRRRPDGTLRAARRLLVGCRKAICAHGGNRLEPVRHGRLG